MKKIKQKIQQAIAQRLFPGCIIGLLKNKKRFLIREGHFTYDNNSPKTDENSIFDVASITKSIPTACLALKLIEKNNLSLQDKVIDYIPEIKNNYRDQILVKHLLTQTLNFGFSLSSCKELSPNQILNHIFQSELAEKPGTRLFYCNPTSILLGILIESASKKNLDTLSQELLFKPLKMRRTAFHHKQFPISDIVPTEIDQWRGREIRGEIHDETAWKLQKIMIPASAGLFSTANDLLNFAEMLLNKGIFHYKTIFKPETIELMRTNQLAHSRLFKKWHLQGDKSFSAETHMKCVEKKNDAVYAADATFSTVSTNAQDFTGLGFELNQPLWMGKKCAVETFGKTGFTGCSILVNISQQIGLVILSNCTYPQRKRDKREINEFRREIAEIAME